MHQSRSSRSRRIQHIRSLYRCVPFMFDKCMSNSSRSSDRMSIAITTDYGPENSRARAAQYRLDRLMRRTLDKTGPAIFQVFADRDLTVFRGTAWKLRHDLLLTCWHVIGKTYPDGLYGQQKPLGTPELETVYLVDASKTAAVQCSVDVRHFGTSDMALLKADKQLGDFASVPALPLAAGSNDYADQTTCLTLGFARPDDIRRSDGRVQGSYTSSSGECLLTAHADFGMSGGVVLNLEGLVLGMITGAVGEAQHKSRMLQGTAIRLLLALMGIDV